MTGHDPRRRYYKAGMMYCSFDGLDYVLILRELPNDKFRSIDLERCVTLSADGNIIEGYLDPDLRREVHEF